MMRSHTRPWGQCLLCMRRFILEVPGVQVGETGDPGRGPAFVGGWPRGGRGVRGRWGLELHCAAEAWFMCTVGSQAGVLALNLALLQTSLPWRSAVPTAKQNIEERNVLNSTPVLTAERGRMSPPAHLWVMAQINNFFISRAQFKTPAFIVILHAVSFSVSRGHF